MRARWALLGGAAALMARCAAPTIGMFNPTEDAGLDAAADVSMPMQFADVSRPETSTETDAAPPAPPIVYGTSWSALYKLDTSTNVMTKVFDYSFPCSATCNIYVIALALNSKGDMYLTTFGGFFKVDLTTGVCTLISEGEYPNSLGFLPKGTLDPTDEALVGYQGSTYVRINLTTGAMTTVGALTQGYSSSGDIVSVYDGGTFLSVTGGPSGECSSTGGDCILQVDPKTGDLIRNYGPSNHVGVFGLAFWGGTAYGFAGTSIFSFGWNGSKIVVANLAVTEPMGFPGFTDATSTPTAPAFAPDGGGLPIN